MRGMRDKRQNMKNAGRFGYVANGYVTALLRRSKLPAWLAIPAIVALPSLATAQTLNLADLPLSVQSEIPPNIIVTLDDSGSMAWGWMPDGRNSNWRRNYYRSSHYNKIYYDPTVTYAPPNLATGAATADANFDAAIRGVFYDNEDSVTVNLRTGYTAVYYHYSGRNPLLLGQNYVDNGNCAANLCSPQAGYYFQFNDDVAVNPGCTGTDAEKLVDEDCYDKVVITDGAQYPAGTNSYGRSQAEEETNFANWYQYYGIRADASKSAVQRAFIPESVSSNVRVGRQALNTDNDIESGGPSEDNDDIAEFDTAERAGFYDWVASVPTNGGTPVRRAVKRAGDYFTDDNAYYTNASAGSGPIVACRVNTHILVTDGYYNGSFDEPGNFKIDQTNTTLPDGTNYVTANTPIYSNNLDSESIADLAFHYWATDLRPEANNINPFKAQAPGVDPDDYWHPRNDPATWQHMNSFGIAFGAQGTISKDAATFQQLLDGTLSWPQTVRGKPTTIDDLYHSAINGRGDFFNAGNPDELVDALNEITSRIGDRQGNAPSVGASSGRITDGTKVYIASFATESWSGDLQAFTISDGSDFQGAGSSGTGCNAKPLGSICTPNTSEWSAAAQNDELDGHMQPSSRKIFTYSNSATQGSGQPAGTGVSFEWGSSTPLNATQQALLNQSDGLGKERVNYIRGDDANELDNGGDFRTRSSVAGGTNPASRVGAIVHANPVYSGPGGAVGADTLQFAFPDDLEASPYSLPSRSAIVYAGGNDGMLHAYAAGNGSSAGQELFGYVPDAIMKKLPELTDPDFKSGAFVDGGLTLQDTFYGSSWHSLLVGGLRSGGQGYYALDVTNPPTGASADPADLVEWEFTDFHDSDMGYSYGEPLVARANNGEWVVIVANGYNSTEADGRVGSGKAVLYVLAADDGELLAKIPVGSGDAVDPSGLSSPVAVSDFDVNHFATKSTGTDVDNFTVDYVYAGDLDGNLWKFDLSSTNPAQWNNAVLMYSAGDEQPITAKPAVGTFPSRGSDASNQQTRFVYFGTGQYIDPTDVSTTDEQAFYGIIDDDSCTSSTEACVKQSKLVEQEINQATDVLSSNPLSADDKGWWLELGSSPSAERVVGGIAVVSNVVAFTSLTPNGDACDAGGTSFLYALNRFSGGATSSQVIDFNSDGEITSSDYGADDAVRSRKELGSIVIDTKLLGGPSDEFVLFGESGAEVLLSGDRKGRVRWRQIK
ncbi:MAG: hypothetical protein KJO24_05290 [Gammaproteobacteria bacterium]|nr:hypothetical protein [Gammaproteobacteria bacterium]